ATERKDEIIVRERFALHDDFFFGEIKIDDLVHQNGQIRLVVQVRADGLRDIRGGKTSSGHLVKQRLEQVMVPAVDESDAGVLIGEMFAKLKPSEAGAKNHDVRTR